MIEDIYLRFATALSIGLVVGIERGWRDRDEAPGSRTAGVRTFTLVALLGATSAALARDHGAPLILVTSLLTFGCAFSWFKVREADEEKDFSVTTVVAALLVFVLGAYCIMGAPELAAAVGVASAGLLASREFLHGALARLTWLELRSALLLLAMTVIVLPLLPDRTIDPFGSVNPREVWLFTVLAGAISYLGYIAVRLLGSNKGLLVTSAAGAVVSSTAVTVAMARRAQAGEAPRRLAGAASLACMISTLRVLTIVAFVRPAILVHAAPACLAAAAALGAAAMLLVRSEKEERETALAHTVNPFDLMPLLVFAATLAGVQLAVGWVISVIGPQGIVPSSALVGIVDVDVAVLTVARNVDLLGGARITAIAILLAMAVNAVARVVYAAIAGPMVFLKWLAIATSTGFVFGYAGFRLLPI